MREWTERHIREIIEDMIKGLGGNTRIVFPLVPLDYNGDYYCMRKGADIVRWAIAYDYIKTEIWNDGYADYITDKWETSLIDLERNAESLETDFERDGSACNGAFALPPSAEEIFKNQFPKHCTMLNYTYISDFFAAGYNSLITNNSSLLAVPTTPPFSGLSSLITPITAYDNAPPYSEIMRVGSNFENSLLPIKFLQDVTLADGVVQVGNKGYINVKVSQV